MQIVIDIPNSDIPLKQNVIILDLHFIDGHICECTHPFKELPKKHGRLIDADALFQDLREHNIPFNNDINSAINVAPTILEAEL